MSKVTPMMQQYDRIKSEYSDCILFFRLGDFYEMFGKDAEEASQILDITLTSRSKSEDSIPMCGIPYHSSENYIAKLNQKGKKVAICEQTSSPGGKGIVEREVVRVVTPSTNLSETVLNAKQNSFFMTILGLGDQYSASIFDVSTGEVYARKIQEIDEIEKLIVTYDIKEIIFDEESYQKPEVYKVIKKSNVLATKYKPEAYDISSTKEQILKQINHIPDEIQHAVILGLVYLQKELLVELKSFQKIQMLGDSDDFFELDRFSIVNLEIFQTIADGNKKNSLLNTIDFTCTAMGGRFLRKSIIRPLKNKNLILDRQSYVQTFYDMSSNLSQRLKDTYKSVYDLERLTMKIELGLANPKDLVSIYMSLLSFNSIKDLLSEFELLNKKLNQHNDFNKIIELLSVLETENIKVSTRDAGIFKDGIYSEIDELRDLTKNGKQKLLELHNKESLNNNISTLKLGFNKVFGYYFEVSKGRVDQVPSHFIRKQTLTNGERYITEELKQYEEKILNADSRLNEIEFKYFQELIIDLKKFTENLFEISTIVAETDFYRSLAEAAQKNNYIKPSIREDRCINLKNARHPVIEKILSYGEFIPNDIEVNEKNYIKIITGPNMGGKSTYLRQTALIILLAQIGSFVPSSYAEIGLVDQIFTRVGASDNLSEGKSTFLLEMEETAFILKSATNKSFIIMDEVGRGTSTIDGVSLANSIVEFLSTKIQSTTFFATHYHELIEFSKSLSNTQNLSIAVKHDDNGYPVFLHKIIEGGMDKSYGIEVAEIAGIPLQVIQRSREILADGQIGNNYKVSDEKYSQVDLFEDTKENYDRVSRRIKSLEVDQIKPIEALQILDELKKYLS